MKKNYISPEITLHALQTQSILLASITGATGSSTTGGDDVMNDVIHQEATQNPTELFSSQEEIAE